MIPDPAACRIGITAGHTVLNLEVWHPDWGSAATEALRRSLAAPDVSRSPRERDPLAVMPGDPSWATNGEGQERVLEFKQG